MNETKTRLGLFYTLEEAATECGMTINSFKRLVYNSKVIEPVFTQEAIDAFKSGKLTKIKRGAAISEGALKAKVRKLEKEVEEQRQRIVRLERKSHDHSA